MVQPKSQNQNEASLKVLACTGTLMELAVGPGWNGDYKDLEQREQGISLVKKLLTLDQLSLCIWPSQIETVHRALSECAAPARAWRAVDQLLEWSSVNLRVDYDRALEQANKLAWSQELLDFDDVSLLVLANLLRADFMLVQRPEQFKQVVEDYENELPAFNIPIETLASLPASIAQQEIKTSTSDSITAWTPQFRIIELPKDSTPIDFAYAIHSEIGNSCVKASINGNEVPLNTYLKQGDMVKIITGDTEEPDLAWLEFVKTPLARRSITRAVRLARQRRGWQRIKDLLGDAVKDYRPALDSFAHERRYTSVDELAVKVGSGQVTPQELREWVMKYREKLVQEQNVLNLSIGFDNPNLPNWELAGCCNPLPGDSIKGLQRSGSRPLRVHRENCSKLKQNNPEQLVSLEWQFKTCAVQFGVIFKDQADVLRPILNRISERDYEPNLRKLRLLKSGQGQAWIDIHNISSRADWVNVAKEVKLLPQVHQVAIKQVTPFL